jgi:hypothetical protein
MPVRVLSFEASVDNERAALAFDMRATLVDFLRKRIKDTISRAEDVEIDRDTALRRFSLTYAGTAKAYRLPRTVPASLVSWCAYAEVNSGRDGFPPAMPGTVATFSKEAVTSLPGNLLLVKLGGVMFVGPHEGGVPEDLFELRVRRGDEGKYWVTMICGRMDGDNRAEMPEPVEPEPEDVNS